MPESVENDVELILIFATVAMIGISVSFKPLHKWLSRKPWLGIIIFTLISGGLFWIWGGIWQLWTIQLLLGIVVFEYLFLTIRPNKALQVTVPFNQKLFLLCGYTCIGATILFPTFLSMEGLTHTMDIGSWKMVVESTDRSEVLDQTQGLKRRFALQLYYPVQGKSGKHKNWIEGGDKAIRGMALSYGLPEMVVSHLKSVESSARLSRKILQKELPYQVVVISHGLKSGSDLHVRLAESLADKGYFVVVVNHPYSAFAAVYNSKDYILGAKYPSAQMHLVDEKIELERQMTLVQQGDLLDAFKVLELLNQGRYDNRFKGMIDLSDLTLVGHQIGGGAVMLTLNQVPFVKTGVLINPMVEQISKKYILEGSAKPVIALVSKDYLSSNNASYLIRYLQSSDKAELVESEMGKDLDMTDISQISPLFVLNGLSDGRQANRRLVAAQVYLIDQAVQKYSQGQIIEDSSRNLDLAGLKLSLLEPNVIDAK